MITSSNSTASYVLAKIPGRVKQLLEDNDRLQDLGDEDDRDEGDNGII